MIENSFFKYNNLLYFVYKNIKLKELKSMIENRCINPSKVVGISPLGLLS